MVRILILKAFFLMTVTVWASQQEAKSDLIWSDIGNNALKIEYKVRVQKDYNSISDKEGLMPIGSFIRLVQDINLRKTPKGELIKPLFKGQDFQVLNVIVDNNGTRYYKVKFKEDFGYLYAGTKASYPEWIKQTWSSKNKIIPEPGDIVKVKRIKGLKISKKISDKNFFYSIPKNSEIQVKSITQDKSGKLYYGVKYRSKTGFAKVTNLSTLAKAKNWSEFY